MQIASAEFHVFASIRESQFELQVPDEEVRIQFCSLFAAARHARKHPLSRNATLIIHDPTSNHINRIPLATA